ncbi:MAG: ribosomal protein S18-alanine N-acetyltransferase [Gammaproteobacteria bacterium]|nr:ribosomal protein S18-alanine N-acetyltransferase [Gammaproteobacteria bacterium]
MSAVVQEPEYCTRPMEPGDLAQVMEIETSVYKFPWSRQIFKDCIRVGYSCQVVTHHDDIAAYAVMSSGAGEAHLLNICVKQVLQGQGIGQYILHSMIELAREKNVHTIYLEVRPSNEVALGLYLKNGFNEIGTRKDYYPANRGREDALVLALNVFND